MRTAEVRNARIESTQLGNDDHGGISFWLRLDYGGSGQGFGGYSLGGTFTHTVIEGILTALKKDSWENLPGTSCRAWVNEDGIVKRIGHYLDDKWFDIDEAAAEFQAAKNV